MIRVTKKHVLVLAFAGALFGGCAQQDARPQAASVPDDDAFCQSRGFKPGSDEYVACRRDRDYVSGLQAQQSKRDLRKIQDYMMDNK